MSIFTADYVLLGLHLSMLLMFCFSSCQYVFVVIRCIRHKHVYWLTFSAIALSGLVASTIYMCIELGWMWRRVIYVVDQVSEALPIFGFFNGMFYVLVGLGLISIQHFCIHLDIDTLRLKEEDSKDG